MNNNLESRMDIGIVGYGNIAQKHQLAITGIDGLNIKAIYDTRVLEGLEIKAFTDLNSFLSQDLDLIVICSPNGYHKAHSIAALETGHHVICEKPFALNAKDCEEMIAVAKKNDRKIFCTMQNRFSGVSQWLKELVDSKSLGDIYMINVSCYWNRNKDYYAKSDWRGQLDIDGGTLFTQFSHYVDTLYWLFGDLEISNALFKNFDHDEMIDFEDTGIFNFKLAQGGLGTFAYTTSCFEKNFESTMTILGSKGTVKVAGQYMNQIEYCHIDSVETPELVAGTNIENLSGLYQNILAHMNEKKPISSPAEHGLEVVKIIEQVYQYKNNK